MFAVVGAGSGDKNVGVRQVDEPGRDTVFFSLNSGVILRGGILEWVVAFIVFSVWGDEFFSVLVVAVESSRQLSILRS